MEKITPTNTTTGLTAAEVASRIAAGQINVTNERTSRSLGDILKANIFTRFNLLLGILTAIVVVVGSPADALFGLVIIINAAIGTFQEVRAKRTLDNLAILTAPTTLALRDSVLTAIAATEVVLGDILHIKSGDQIPSDGVVLQSDGLEIDEALLTGESEPIIKKQGGEVLSGAIVVAGQATIQVTAVGKDAYVHKLAAKVKRFSIARSELVDGTNKLLKYISWLIVLVAPVLVIGQLNSGNSDWKDALVRSTAAIVGMIPEGLVLLTSLAFALAVIALARRKVLVQQLPAVEGLARVDVICVDKTGTLTERDIVFDDIIMLDKKTQGQAQQVLATLSNEPNSPTLSALHAAFGKHKVATTTAAIAFSSARKWSAITLQNGDSWVMGAPEILLPKTDKARAQAHGIALGGKRVMVLARSKTAPSIKDTPEHLQPTALIILSEKIRPDAKKTLEFFAGQGVALKVLSGDNPHTVGAIARRVGIACTQPFDARELPQDPKKLAALVATQNVFGRVTPDQKRSIIKALQANGHVVAMTGDGVNDALALKDANIGIAMASGASATKAIAELVLLDNQFARLPNVLAEGRRVIANIERVANLFVIKNAYSLLLALAVIFTALPYPFLPRHLTLLSALTIGIPAFFLALAPNNQRYRPGFLRRVLWFAVPVGLIIGAAVMAMYVLVGEHSSAAISTLSSVIVMFIGTWVLLRVAHPLNWWKFGLVLLMPLSFAAAFTLPIIGDALAFDATIPQLGVAIGLGLLGATLVEVVWQVRKNRLNSQLLLN